jgi:hypothetical protein
LKQENVPLPFLKVAYFLKYIYIYRTSSFVSFLC